METSSNCPIKVYLFWSKVGHPLVPSVAQRLLSAAIRTSIMVIWLKKQFVILTSCKKKKKLGALYFKGKYIYFLHMRKA